jgi:hypothetical protein
MEAMQGDDGADYSEASDDEVSEEEIDISTEMPSLDSLNLKDTESSSEDFEIDEEQDELHSNVNRDYQPFRDPKPIESTDPSIASKARPARTTLNSDDVRRKVASGIKSTTKMFTGRKRNSVKASSRQSVRDAVKNAW